MTTATISVSLPKNAGEAALILLRQMTQAVDLGHVIAGSAPTPYALDVWRRSAQRVLDDSEFDECFR